jgi:hypothetical protein
VVEISGRDNPKVNILQLIKKWLSNKKSNNWPIILDNIDTIEPFFYISDGNMLLIDNLPHAFYELILITLWNKTAAQNLVL